MATKEEIARYGWTRSAAFGILALVLALVTAGTGEGSMLPLLLGIGGIALLTYSLIRRDRDRRDAGQR